MQEDFAGNTLGTAKALELTSSLQTFTGSVSPLDTNDYYGFNLSNHSSFNVTLSGLGANADLQLLKAGVKSYKLQRN
ncbi:MAG TPA: PPC domain-containing protein [Allocoleopsis sp.]